MTAAFFDKNLYSIIMFSEITIVRPIQIGYNFLPCENLQKEP